MADSTPTSSDEATAKVALHNHTFHSDGSEGVKDLIRHAARDQVTYLAVTDHDSSQVWRKRFERLRRLSPSVTLTRLQPFPGGYLFYPEERPGLLMRMYFGIEFTVVVTNHPEESVHILGLGIDPPSPDHQIQLNRIAQARFERVKAVTEEINRRDDGIYRRIQLTWDGPGITVRSVIGPSMYPTRMHIAATMDQLGILHELGYEGPREVVDDPNFWRELPTDFDAGIYPTTSDLIARIHTEMKGVAVLANPDKWKNRKYFLAQLVDEGLDGYEVYGRGAYRSSGHHLSEREFERALLDEREAFKIPLVTGGRDHHGKYTPLRVHRAGFGVDVPKKEMNALDSGIASYKLS